MPYILFIWPQNATVRIGAVYKETCFLHHILCDHIQSIKNITQLAADRRTNEKSEKDPSFNTYLSSHLKQIKSIVMIFRDFIFKISGVYSIGTL